MKIKIEYLLKGENNWKEKYLTSEEFFDPLDDEDIDEGFSVNSISKHFFKPYLYVVDDINKILYLNILIEIKNEVLIEKFIYLNEDFYFRELIKSSNKKVDYRQLNLMAKFENPTRIEASFVLNEIDGVLYPLSGLLSPDLDNVDNFESIDFKPFKELIMKNKNKK